MPNLLIRRFEWFQSTHSLRSATCVCQEAVSRHPVSIHALLAECDTVQWSTGIWVVVSIHALLAECDRIVSRNVRINKVSIHALLAECDCRDLSPLLENPPFQSTHSLRSATRILFPLFSRDRVSIHALLAECDFRGGKGRQGRIRFQSTHSLRSATHCG